MNTETKFFIGIGIITLVVVVAGAILLSKQSSSQQQTQEENQTVDQAELIANAQHTIGNPTAVVTVVEFADLQCPACRAANPILNQVLKTYPNDVYYVFRHYPLSIHKNARKAAQAAEAAAKQGKFFEISDKLFTNQPDWQDSGNPEEFFEKYASELGLDLEKFKTDSNAGSDAIDSDFALGNKYNVQSTPTFFINGQRQPGVVELTQFEQIINSAKGINTSEQPAQSPDSDQ